MYRVRVERLIDKPIEQVFEQLVDHAKYSQFPGVVLAKLLEPGQSEPNGVGALRYIDAGSMQLTERIVSFERPTFMAYHIESSKPFLIDLEKGQVNLTAEGQSTRVVWISEGRIKMPLIGAIMDKMFEKQFARGFGAILKHIAKT